MAANARVIWLSCVESPMQFKLQFKLGFLIISIVLIHVCHSSKWHPRLNIKNNEKNYVYFIISSLLVPRDTHSNQHVFSCYGDCREINCKHMHSHECCYSSWIHPFCRQKKSRLHLQNKKKAVMRKNSCTQDLQLVVIQGPTNKKKHNSVAIS